MPSYGNISKQRLDTCHSMLQKVFKDVMFALPWTDPVSGITINDCSILCGVRTEEAQDLAYKQETSLVKWPNSKHNVMFPEGLSMAVDAAPYHMAKPHIHWKDIDEMEAFSRLVLAKAEARGIALRWGGDWDGDGVRVDKDPSERLLDGPHFELMI